MPKLTITIDRIGKTKVEASGFTGSACTEGLSKKIVEGLSDPGAEDSVVQECKAEYYQTNTETNHLYNG